MYYSRPTLVSNWHQNREAEPKDYDLTVCSEGKKNLLRSTYKNLGRCGNTDWITTTEGQLSQCHLKKDYEIRETPKPLVKADNFNSACFDRETRRPKTGFSEVLPRHQAGHNKIDMDTTYALDYLPPYSYSTQSCVGDQAECSAAYRRCQSQFTDTADYRRQGRNTWQDESGVYGNSHIRRRVFPRSHPITPHIL
ncbi:cilia- and flagella-associated protein 95 [Lepisosteus oculatus]|uniref:cilia- and flagella-associated protein 95 n=1 Tax=Lepisosteus oculatus TaxID=7918 RepID=UPI003717F183